MNDKIAESTQTDSTPTEPLRTLRRRTILAGAVWSVPAVGVALATPAAAAASATATGTIVFDPNQYRGTRANDRVKFTPLTGLITVSRGSLPTRVFINFSDPSPGRVDLRRDAGRYTTVNQATGRFQFTGVYNAIVGGDNPFGFAYAGVEEADSGGITFGYATAELIG
ncbi:hypothetical protein [Rathayibacter iranicus]|uniref:Uncharacterized protein n=2 Tax=Rathayibacter iranicus TaxID=59737 RepID=A0AAD1AER9_9MICO|nr:hypothetical protein [Rathayibacter iranicus]AZZ56898.1 hypothetical protein C7V51_14200 [Rathayibacter iranicus]MWV29497.1 hypothetical protein [Rathayibacter iranicus NCPPB 2253 = VKM Ac-1602]PPI42411.1 hypothetical protein C5E09_13055 [Rathayibacter iranicus]PPI57833.1 hypothetical protein C5E08_13955 [Rathayibacter iranicus]PPI68771.1 hypothetical protein C5E01_13010 [Rathayibacter iranicus]